MADDLAVETMAQGILKDTRWNCACMSVFGILVILAAPLPIGLIAAVVALADPGLSLLYGRRTARK